MNHKSTITLETERLILRRFTPEDYQDLFEYLSDEETIKYEPYDPITFEQSKEWAVARSDSDAFLAVCLRENGKLIGNLFMQKQEQQTYELGYVFNRIYWHKGYATEAVNAAIKYVFRTEKAHRIHAQCNPVNTASWKLLERIGFGREGFLKSNVYFNTDEDGKPIWQDTCIYAMTADDYFFGTIISVHDNPQYYERAVDYFSAKWSINRKIYEESITDAINTDKPLPRWYLMLRGDDIIGSYGLIENDFMVRKDLTPWLCALYIEENERGKALGAKLLKHGQEEAAKLGFDKVYLCTDHVGYYEKYGWSFFGMEESEFGGNTRVYSIDAAKPADFWNALDALISSSEIIIDRPKGTKHPRFDFIYPLDYGYLKDTASSDGGGIDVWVGSLGGNKCDAVICTVDLLKKDSEIKILRGCTEAEKDAILRFHNNSEHMKGLMIRRGNEKSREQA